MFIAKGSRKSVRSSRKLAQRNRALPAASLRKAADFALENLESRRLLSTAVQTLNFPQAGVSFANHTDWDDTQMINQFDPSLGTLTEVDLTWSGAMQTQIKVENISSQSGNTITSQVVGQERIGGLGIGSGVLVSSVIDLHIDSFPVFDNDPADQVSPFGADFAGPSGKSYAPVNGSGGNTVMDTNALDLTNFTGMGTVPYSMNAFAVSQANDTAGNFASDIETTATGTLTVTYIYTPIPHGHPIIATQTGILTQPTNTPPVPCDDTYYPNTTNDPLTSVTFNESTMLAATDPGDGTLIDISSGSIKVWITDEAAPALGVRQVTTTTSGGTTTQNYTVTPMGGSGPSSAHNPATGVAYVPPPTPVTETPQQLSLQGATDVSGRPMEPSLFITDITGLDPNSLAAHQGDWQYGGTPVAPTDIFGAWKAFTKTINLTNNTETLTADPNPSVKNGWNLGPGSDAPPAGTPNAGYGLEARWDLASLGLIPGHQYRFYVIVHDGDQNKVGGDAGQTCVNAGFPTSAPVVTPGNMANLGDGSQLVDSAQLGGGINPTGTITFKLFDPGNNLVFTNTVPVNGNGFYNTSAGYTPTQAGTYQWIAFYSGDANNDPAQSVPGSEPETVKAPPTIKIVKHATPTIITPGMSVHYTYDVTNPGTVPLHNVVVTDDNATPGFTGDDFNPAPVLSGGFNVGDVNMNNLLDPGEDWKYSATVIPPIPMCIPNSSGGMTNVGSMVIIDQGTSLKFIYLQSTDLVDNTYGTNASAGWTKGHTFSELVGSDHAEFQLKDSLGNLVLDFSLDYVSQSASFPSGYGTLGFSGGDGKFISGDPSKILSYDTTITDDLNQSPAYYGFTTNSPSPSDPLFAGWTVVDGYQFVIDKSAFGANGFGSVSVPLVHNSPSKTGVGGINPEPCPGTDVNTAKVTALAPDNTMVMATATATVKVVTDIQPSSLSGFVYVDSNNNGIKEAGEAPIPGTTINLTGTDFANNPVSLTTTTDANGFYNFNLFAGTYTIDEVQPAGFIDGKDTQGTPGTGTTAVNDEFTNISLDSGVNGVNNNFGERLTAQINITKTASQTTVLAGQPVTFTYHVTDPGTSPLSNVHVTDDNGTPGFTSDDFAPMFVGGDTNNNGLLDPGEDWVYTATVTESQPMCMTINGNMVPVGTLMTIDQGSSIKVVYRQSTNVVDNTYGNTVSSGYPSGHKFSDLTGSDMAEFRFTDGKGNTVLDFNIDYLSAISGNPSFPSGFGTLGFNGGDGKFITGTKAWVLSYDTTESHNLNQSSAYYGFTSNSPATSSPLAANWDYVDGYTVVISKTAFGANGFGGVTLPLVHDSPSKLGINAITPMPCNGTVTNTAVATGIFNGVTLTASAQATVNIITTVTNNSSLAGFVYFDANNDGVFQSGESPIPGTTITLTGTDVLGNPVNLNTNTLSDGSYKFSSLVPGTYTITETQPAGFLDGKDTQGTPGNGTTNNDQFANISLGSGVNGVNNNFGELLAAQVNIAKSANKNTVLPGAPVTFTYMVTNPGTAALSNVNVTDDNGTPGYTADDFTPTYVSGDTNHNSKLDPNEVWIYNATVYEPQPMCITINNQMVQVGTLQTIDLGSDIEVIYRQTTNLVDNTYGTNASAGWTKGHTFSDLTGSDKAEFRFTDGNGNVALDFYLDYISQSAAFPSGYGTLGFSGGDGSFISGSMNNVVSYDTTESHNLNQSPAFYGYTTNSPGASDPNLANWDVVDGYTVVVSKNAFGAAGFGGVTIPLVHNSPSKLGVGGITPMPCNGSVTNTAVATGVFNNVTLTASAQATVNIVTTPAASSLAGFVYADTNNDGVKQASESGIPGTLITLTGTDIFSQSVNLTTTTGSDGSYKFASLLPGTYTITETQPAGFQDGKDTQGTPGNGTTNNDQFANINLAAGVNGVNNNFGEILPGAVAITKSASANSVGANTPVTFTYTVTNPGTQPVSNVVVNDDNGTPNYAGDDFHPAFVGGDTNNNGLLDPSETWTYTATVTEPQFVCATINGQQIVVGELFTIDLGTNIKVIYRQSTAIVDNTYGDTSSPDWGKIHTFNDLTGSDHAEFLFTDSKGNTVLDFNADYITASNMFPSGYGTLGVSGGDGGMITGSASNIVSIDTTESHNLNQSPSYYGFTVNSPATSNPLSANWDFVDGYTVVVKKSAFGVNGFGSVSIPLVHNSPAKMGPGGLSPMPCDETIVNTATVKAKFGATPISAQATASVFVDPPPIAPVGPGDVDPSVHADSNVVTAGQQVGFTITLTAMQASTGVALTDLLPAGAGNDINWHIDTTVGDASAFQLTGAVGSQSLSLVGTPSMAKNQTLTVHVVGTTTLADVGSISDTAMPSPNPDADGNPFTDSITINAPATVVATAPTISGNTLTYTVTNNTTAAISLAWLQYSFPTGNGNLTKISINGTTIFNTSMAGPNVIVSGWLANTLATRTLAAGQSFTISFTFSKTASTDPTKYKLHLDFGNNIAVDI